MIELMQRDRPGAAMWHHRRVRPLLYEYPSGREGDSAAAGFSARKAATVVYVTDGVGAHTELLERLGPHTTGVACIYLKHVDAVDAGILETIVSRSYAALTAGTYTQRAREGGKP
jgi:hypothetical protein